MQLRTLLAAGLSAAVLASPVGFAQNHISEASALGASIVVAAPFSLVYVSGTAMSNASQASVNLSRRWHVANVRPRGAKTELELRCDDQQVKLDITIDTRIAQERRIKVGDALDIDAIGKTGYTVRKGEATVATLAVPGAGMVHSAVRG